MEELAEVPDTAEAPEVAEVTEVAEAAEASDMRLSSRSSALPSSAAISRTVRMSIANKSRCCLTAVAMSYFVTIHYMNLLHFCFLHKI